MQSYIIGNVADYFHLMASRLVFLCLQTKVLNNSTTTPPPLQLSLLLLSKCSLILLVVWVLGHISSHNELSFQTQVQKYLIWGSSNTINNKKNVAVYASATSTTQQQQDQQNYMYWLYTSKDEKADVQETDGKL